MNNFKCIIFDLDGTLIDSIPELYSAYKNFLNKFGYIGNKKEFELLNGPKLDEIISLLKKKYNLKPSKLILKNHYQNEIEKIYKFKIVPNTGVKKLLNFLKLNGYVMGIATSSSKKNTYSVLSKNNLFNYFSFFVCGDDVSISKPNPQIYQKCIKLSGFKKNEIFVLEDSKNGFDSAKKAGLTCKKTTNFKSVKQWLSENNISPKYDIIESNSCVVTIKSTRKTIAKNTQKQINQSWNNLQKTKSVKLSNDKVLVMKSISTKKKITHISGEFIDYKNIIINKINNKINLIFSPIGVSGIILFKNNNSYYTIFGKRSKNISEYPNHLELIPSGHINKKFDSNKKLKFNQDLINEFIEETGLSFKFIKKVSFLSIVKDKENSVYDLCSIIELNVNKKFISKNFQSFEYSKPIFVKFSKLTKFIEKNHKQIIPTSMGILDIVLNQKNSFS